MGRHLAFVLMAAGAVTGCATYTPAPLTSAGVATNYARRSLAPEVVRQDLAHIAPSAQWDGASWDRLALFAALSANNPGVVAARSRAISAEYAARAARAGPAMTLTLTAEYARSAPDSSPWLYGATSDVPLDIGARRAARVRSSDLAALMARYDYAEVLWAARLGLRRALAERFIAARQVSIAEELARVRARQLAAMQRRFDAGEVARIELERVRADTAADTRRLAESQARSIAARAALADALGVPSSVIENVPLAWDGFDAPTAPADADIASARQDALLSRADVLRAVAAYDVAESDLRGAVARQYPELHLGPGYTWERGLVKLPFSLGLVLPPLDFNRNAIRAAEASRMEAAANLERSISLAQNAIDTALGERGAARAALTRIRSEELASARTAARQSDLEIEQGAIDRVDWAAAQASYLQAQLAELDALLRVHTADSALEDALRRPLEGPEMLIVFEHATGGAG